MRIDIAKLFRKVKSQKRGWVIITAEDRDWASGKPLETKELQRIADILKKSRQGALTFTLKYGIIYLTIKNWRYKNECL